MDEFAATIIFARFLVNYLWFSRR